MFCIFDLIEKGVVARFFIIIIVFSSSFCYGQFEYFKLRFDSLWNNLTDTTFLNLVKENNLTIQLPDSFEQVSVMKNYDAFYQYGIKHKKANFEVRYNFRETDYASYDTSALKLDDFSYSLLSIYSMNASGTNFVNMPEIHIVSANELRSDLNIEWEAYVDFKPRTDFGKGYSFCRIYSRRINAAFILYYILLFTDFENQKYLEDIALKTIKTKI